MPVAPLLTWLRQLDLAPFLALVALANLAMYAGSILLVAALQSRLPHRALNAGRARASRQDLALSALVVVVNIAVVLPGWLLWRSGRIRLLGNSLGAALIDLAILVACFDLALYLLHRAMHAPRFYAAIHARHHEHRDLSGLSFYVMNPLEAAGFGALLISLLAARDFELVGLLGFLFVNWLYGTIGHSGVRFESRLIRWVAGDSEFHHRHHALAGGNYGFFTPVWDALLGTRLPAPRTVVRPGEER